MEYMTHYLSWLIGGAILILLEFLIPGLIVIFLGLGALTTAGLTQNSGFAGVSGAFRLRRDGTNERALAVATIRSNQVVVLDPAPRSFGGFGF